VKLITGIVVAGLLTGCASAEQRMESKRDYRDAQVEAIKVQAEQQTARQTGEQLAEAAMWQSLAEAVKANPESASHFAIVMAVAASKSDAKGESNTTMATIKTERDVTALDWAKVLTGPVLGTVTQVGIAALNTDLQKEISRNNTARDINDSDNDARLYGVIGEIVDSRDTGTSVTYTVSDNATVNTGTYTQDNDVTTTTSTTTSTVTTTTTDDDVYVIGTTAEEADNAVDEVIDEVSSFGIIDDVPPVVVDDTDTDDTTDVVDCSFGFSPQPPECQE
jgi:hypothetical protein